MKLPAVKRLAASCALAALFALSPLAGAKAALQDHPIVKLRSLDKITARTMTFEARVGSTIKFGTIYIKVQSCRKSEPTDPPESAAFLQIWEVPPGPDSRERKAPKPDAQWIFSGWMFASSPALSPMNHPIYDVWVIDCLAPPEQKPEQKTEGEEGEKTDETPAADKPAPAEMAPAPDGEASPDEIE